MTQSNFIVKQKNLYSTCFQHRTAVPAHSALAAGKKSTFLQTKTASVCLLLLAKEVVRKERSDGIAYAVQACLRKAERLQNNDRFVPKPLRFKCSRILSLFCVICARLVKGLWLFALLLVVIFAKVA